MNIKLLNNNILFFASQQIQPHEGFTIIQGLTANPCMHQQYNAAL